MKHSIRGMVRRNDHSTSIQAAIKVAKHLSELQRWVYLTLKKHGPLTDEQLERYRFKLDRAISTIRKRRTDLCRMGKVVEAGAVKGSRGIRMKLWKAVR